jgi:NIMA-interacting peptidyl-prolyl cis-trans isomerase 1
MDSSQQVQAAHILLKHTESRNPHDSYRNKPITRSKAEAVAGIQSKISKDDRV